MDEFTDDVVTPWKIIFLVLSLIYFFRDSSSKTTLLSVLRTLFKIRSAAATTNTLRTIRDPTTADPDAGKGVTSAVPSTFGLCSWAARLRHLLPSKPLSQMQDLRWSSSLKGLMRHFPWLLQYSGSHNVSCCDLTKISSVCLYCSPVSC